MELWYPRDHRAGACHVLLQAAALRKLLAAVDALKVLLAGVGDDVLVQLGLVQEPLAAERTEVLPVLNTTKQIQ